MVSNMVYLIDGKRQPENYFWNCLHVLASEKEICRVLDGEEIVIGKTAYRIAFERGGCLKNLIFSLLLARLLK